MSSIYLRMKLLIITFPNSTHREKLNTVQEFIENTSMDASDIFHMLAK